MLYMYLFTETTSLRCQENEFACRHGLQCIPLQFLCNFVDDCGDNSDEVSCGPGPVRIDSFRDGSEPDRYIISWVRPQAGGGDIISYTIKYRPVRKLFLYSFINMKLLANWYW